jgi:hypothetical protein
MTGFSESIIEEAALAWPGGLGSQVKHGPEIAQGEPGAERTDPAYRDVILERRLREALTRLNPKLPAEAIDDAFRNARLKASRSSVSQPREQTIDVCHVRAEGVARLWSASDGVEDREVFGAHAVGANVGVLPPPYLFSHRCVPRFLLKSFDTDRRQKFTHDRPCETSHTQASGHARR